MFTIKFFKEYGESMINVNENEVIKIKTRKGFNRHTKYILIILLMFFGVLSIVIIEDFVSDVGHINNLVLGNNANATNTAKPLTCNISYWKNGCSSFIHKIYSNKAINLVELLYEEQDTEEYLHNCTSVLKGDSVLKSCTVDTYIDRGKTEIWWTNITIGKHHTMCYFVMEKQLENGILVSNKNNIKVFKVTAPEPRTIFSGYFEKRNVNDMQDYNSMLRFYRGIAPVCSVLEYYGE